jgi:hypothetical protein
MTTSGSTNYSVSRTDIFTEALEQLGILFPGETMSDDYINTLNRSLNMMIKAWANEGIGLWKTTEVALFLEYSENKYTISTSGDHCTATYVKTEVKTAGAATDTSIVVDSITGISDGDYIGIELDDGTLQWTTVNGTPSGYTVALDAALTDSAAVDNHVYAYTTKISRPIEIMEARLHKSDDTEISLDLISWDEYTEITNKTDVNTPLSVCLKKNIDSSYIYTWPECNDVKEWIMITVKQTFDDFDAAANTPDFPQEWFLPIALNLAVLVSPKFKVQPSQILYEQAVVAKSEAKSYDVENTSVFFGVSYR